MSDSIPHGFRQIPGFPRYAIDEHGNILSVCNGQWKNKPWDEAKRLKPSINMYGYLDLCLSRDGREHTVKVHRLVLTTFVGPCPDGMECRHIDGNKENNHVSNLVWGTSSENHHDKMSHGTTNRGEKCSRAKLTEKDVLAIRERAANGENLASIANDFPVNQEAIYKIVFRKRWKHV